MIEIDRLKLKAKYGDEKIFVIPAQLGNDIPDKFTKIKHSDSIFSAYDTKGIYQYRADVEYNNAWYQIIPYFYLTNVDKTKFYVGKRLSGDSRLVDKLSLGFGGHIDSSDGSINVVKNALYREMNEELNVTQDIDFKYQGTVKDIRSNTSEHLGLVFSAKVNTRNISIKETDSLSGQWMTLEQLVKNYTKFEGWSKFIIDYLYESNR